MPIGVISLELTDELRAVIQKQLGSHLRIVTDTITVSVESVSERVEEATAAPGELR